MENRYSYEHKPPPPWKGRKYKRIYHENYDAVLKEMGYNVLLRKFAEKAPVSVQLIRQKDEYIWRVQSVFKSYDVTFKRNVEFIEEIPFGMKVKSVMNFETDNYSRLVHKQMSVPPILIVNEFSETNLIQVRSCITIRNNNKKYLF